MKKTVKLVGVALLGYVLTIALIVLGFDNDVLAVAGKVYTLFGWAGQFGFAQIGALVFGAAFMLV